MTHLTIVTVGSLKERYFTEAIGEYKKRLSAYARVEEIELKEERIADEDQPAHVRAALAAEGERILKAIPKDAYTIALCVEGAAYDSVALSSIIGQAADASGKIALVIGSSHGLDPSVKAACDLRLSVSKLTFPHQLMRVMLYEILYRSFTILHGKRYHK
ncbi:MAG: 23S rRNA (pseudouridine(1915)-N(3))-methyltransferase RlmH [Clostridia bacterium]|nr:23S rRNA (pseudouridine(1915)-N(3))-methyltransferase RlmH [Clostridia bacterium]